MKNKMILVVFLMILSLVIVGCGKKDNYEFKFSDGADPGANYSGNINLKSGDATVIVDRGCSIVPAENCGQTHFEYKGQLNDEQLKKVTEILEKTNYADSLDLVISVMDIVQGNEICEEEQNITCIQLGQENLDYLYNNTLK